MESARFSLFEENFRPVWRFWELWRSKIPFGQNVLRMSVLYFFYGKRTVFPFWREFETSVTILRSLTLKNAIWPKWLLLTWKEQFVQFSSKAHCFPFLERIWGQCDDFENFDAQKCDLAKTCCAWPEKSVLYNFHGKRTVFPFWREFEASVTILRSLTFKNAISPKRAAHDLKRGFCTVFIISALFLAFLERFSGQCDDFDNFDAQKCDLAKTCCAWPKKSVLYNFYGKRTVFPFWREFDTSVTILRSLTLKNAIWPKRTAHDLKRAFCTIFIESALFSRFGENLRPVWRFWQLWGSKMRFGRNVLRMT